MTEVIVQNMLQILQAWNASLGCIAACPGATFAKLEPTLFRTISEVEINHIKPFFKRKNLVQGFQAFLRSWVWSTYFSRPDKSKNGWTNDLGETGAEDWLPTPVHTTNRYLDIRCHFSSVTSSQDCHHSFPDERPLHSVHRDGLPTAYFCVIRSTH